MKYEQREMWRGDTLVFEVTVINPATGAPLNLTGAKLWFTAKNNYADADNLAVIAGNTDEGSVVITDAARGLARVDIAPVKTRSMPDGPVRLVYDVQVKDSAGTVTTIESGIIKVYPDVSRAIA